MRMYILYVISIMYRIVHFICTRTSTSKFNVMLGFHTHAPYVSAMAQVKLVVLLMLDQWPRTTKEEQVVNTRPLSCLLPLPSNLVYTVKVVRIQYPAQVLILYTLNEC